MCQRGRLAAGDGLEFVLSGVSTVTTTWSQPGMVRVARPTNRSSIVVTSSSSRKRLTLMRSWVNEDTCSSKGSGPMRGGPRRTVIAVRRGHFSQGRLPYGASYAAGPEPVESSAGGCAEAVLISARALLSDVYRGMTRLIPRARRVGVRRVRRRRPPPSRRRHAERSSAL